MIGKEIELFCGGEALVVGFDSEGNPLTVITFTEDEDYGQTVSVASFGIQNSEYLGNYGNYDYVGQLLDCEVSEYGNPRVETGENPLLADVVAVDGSFTGQLMILIGRSWADGDYDGNDVVEPPPTSTTTTTTTQPPTPGLECFVTLDVSYPTVE